MLKVKLLRDGATAPTVAHPGEDLGYDLYASEAAVLLRGKVVKVPTGIAVEFTSKGMGGVIWDRSSLASKGIKSSGGVLDATYRGEIQVMLTLEAESKLLDYPINKGDKIAQLLPTMSETHQEVVVTDSLTEGGRGDKGFGSTGR